MSAVRPGPPGTPPHPVPDPSDQRARARRSDDAESGGHAESAPGPRELLATGLRHWPLALATFLLVLMACVASTWVIDPVYRAEAQVLVRTEESQQLFPRTSRPAGGGLVRSPVAEVEYTASDAFQDRARAAAGAEAEVEVRRRTGGTAPLAADSSSVLVFQAEAAESAAAAAAANAWASTYVTARHEQDLQEVTELREVLVAERDAAAEERRQLLVPVARLDEVIAQTTDPVELSRLLNQRLALQRSLSVDLDPVEDRLRSLGDQVAALEVDARVLADPQALAFVSTAAQPPEERANGSLQRNLAVGVVAGLVLAAAAVVAARALAQPRRPRPTTAARPAAPTA